MHKPHVFIFRMFFVLSLAVFFGGLAHANLPTDGGGRKNLNKPENTIKDAKGPECEASQVSAKTGNGCVEVVIPFGRPVHDSSVSTGHFNLCQFAPTPTLATPEALEYALCTEAYFEKMETTGLAAGIVRKISIIRANGYRVSYEFKAGESVGLLFGRQKNLHTTLRMLDAAGNPTTSVPAFVEQVYLDGGSAKYDVSSKKMVSLTTAQGKVLTPQNIGVEVLRTSAGVLRQVLSDADGLADIVVTGPQGYEIRFYPHAAVGTKSDGVYAVSGTPEMVWKFLGAAAASGEVDHFQATELVHDAVHSTYEWVYSFSAEEWHLSEANGLRHTQKANQYNSLRTQLVTSQQTYYETGTSGATFNENTQSTEFPFGCMPVSHTVDPDGLALTDRTYYYGETAGTTARDGKIRATVQPDGSWVAYDYDPATGRKLLEVTPWNDQPYDNAKTAADLAASGVAVYYSYAPLAEEPDDTTWATDHRPRVIEKKIQGVSVSKTYLVYKTVNGEHVEITENSSTPGAAYGTVGNQRTTSTYYSPDNQNAAAAAYLKSVVHPDGRQDTYTYESGTLVNGAFVSGSGTALRTSIVHGTVASPDGIACKSTKDVSVEDGLGNEVLTEVYAYTGTGYERMSWVARTFDFFHNTTSVSTSKNTRTEAVWEGNRKVAETDESGIGYACAYDSLGRVASKTKMAADGVTPELVTAYVYDAQDHVLSETVTGGNLSMTASYVYDGAGRLIKSTDQAGLVTTLAYSTDGCTVTVTQPGGGTVVTTKFIGGTPKSISGTGVSAQSYEYGVNPDGTSWTRGYAGAIGAPMWQKTTRDSLGRIVLEEKPGFGGTTISLVSTYDSNGRLIKTATKSGSQDLVAPTLRVYDELGSLVRSGLDVDNNGILDPASSDRITDVAALYEKDAAGVWWTKSVSKTYPLANDATAVTVATSYGRLTGLGADQGDGFILASLAKSVDIHGNETVLKTLLNRSTKTTQQVVTSPFSALPSVKIAVNGLLTSQTTDTGLTYAFSYDGLGRQVGSTDPRTGTAATHYNALGQVDYVQNAAGNQTSFAYDAATGRQTVVENALGKKKYTAYDIKGQVVRTWGDTAYPVENEYDEQGRLVTLKTFRSGTGWESATWPAAPGTADATTWSYDAATGLLLQKKHADGNGPVYTYDAAGRIATRTWARSLGTPGSGSGLLVTTYAYSATTGDMLGTTYSDSTPAVGFTYDRLGRQATVTDAAGTRALAYSVTDLQLDSEGLPDYFGSRMLTRQRDTLGRNAGYQLLGAAPAVETQAGYTYDAYGRTASVTAGQTATPITIASYGYLPNSDLPATTTFANGVVRATAYEASRDLITGIENRMGQTLLSAYSYTNDAIARRTAMGKSGTAFAAPDTISYGYNPRSEVTSAVSASDTNYNYAYTFDPIGNRLAALESGTSKSYLSNTLNQYTAITSASFADTLSFDLDGNQRTLTNATGAWTLTYNAENRLTSAESPVGTGVSPVKRLEFVYDYMGRRISKKLFSVDTGMPPVLVSETRFVYQGYKLIETLDAKNGNASLQKFVWAGDTPAAMTDAASGQTYHYTLDANKNVSELTDSTGAVVAHYEYSPFGKITFKSGLYADVNPFRFSSEYADDEIGLVYYNFRHYDPETGRWTNRDPIEEEGGMNLYGFCANNPLRLIDFLGLFKGIGHDSLTESAAKNATGFSALDIRIMQDKNRNVDRLSNQFNDAAHYMPGTQADADKMIASILDEAVYAEVVGGPTNHTKAMELLGKGEHTVQDQGAHQDQNAGWWSHIFKSPDNPKKHCKEYNDSCKRTTEFLKKFNDRVKTIRETPIPPAELNNADFSVVPPK